MLLSTHTPAFSFFNFNNCIGECHATLVHTHLWAEHGGMSTPRRSCFATFCFTRLWLPCPPAEEETFTKSFGLLLFPCGFSCLSVCRNVIHLIWCQFSYLLAGQVFFSRLFPLLAVFSCFWALALPFLFSAFSLTDCFCFVVFIQ